MQKKKKLTYHITKEKSNLKKFGFAATWGHDKKDILTLSSFLMCKLVLSNITVAKIKKYMRIN